MSEPAATAELTACPRCGAAIEATDAFCEACGTSLGNLPADAQGDGRADGTASHGPDQHDAKTIRTAPGGPFGRTSPCVDCGAQPAEIDADGYCTRCGLLQPGPREHVEVDLSWAAGVTDRGHRHPRNEDAFHLELAGPASERGVVAVVCDGVSSSVHAEDASDVAVKAAAKVLAAVVAGTGPLDRASVHAADAANRAVAALPWGASGSLASPSCTLVSGACRASEVAVAWLGDSRAYWLGPPDGVRQLSVDDSWAEAQVAAGRMTEGEAEADPRSHAITRWLGADAPEGDARTMRFTPAGSGRLLLCSDGLWNYAPTLAQMTELLAGQPAEATPIELARCLTNFARDSGGHDNITVVVIDLVTGAGPPGAGPPGAATGAGPPGAATGAGPPGAATEKGPQ